MRRWSSARRAGRGCREPLVGSTLTGAGPSGPTGLHLNRFRTELVLDLLGALDDALFDESPFGLGHARVRFQSLGTADAQLDEHHPGGGGARPEVQRVCAAQGREWPVGDVSGLTESVQAVVDGVGVPPDR